MDPFTVGIVLLIMIAMAEFVSGLSQKNFYTSLLHGSSDPHKHLIYTLTEESFSLIRERWSCAVRSGRCQVFELHIAFNKNILANGFICKWICYWNFYLVSRQPFYVLELKPFLTEVFEEPFSFQATSLNCLYVSFLWGNIHMGLWPQWNGDI